jgi:hypothetical protein
MSKQACWAQAGSDVEMALGTMASLRATTEDEWHEEVAQLSPKELVEATFQRLFPDSFLYALPVWKHKVHSPENMQAGKPSQRVLPHPFFHASPPIHEACSTAGIIHSLATSLIRPAVHSCRLHRPRPCS